MGHKLPNADPVHKISIIPRGQALGYTLSMPEEDHFLQTRGIGMVDDMAMMLGGRTAEELFCNDVHHRRRATTSSAPRKLARSDGHPPAA